MINLLFRFLICLYLMVQASSAWAGRITISSGDLKLGGEYMTPVRSGMPAILVLHGCGGLYNRDGEVGFRMWRMGNLLQEMGYAVLYLDSFTSRGIKQVCTSRTNARAVTPKMRADDASAAIQWLKSQRDVDGKRIGVLGWSHGADAVLELLGRKNTAIKAAVAYYPACHLLADIKDYRVSAPTLVLVGEKDEQSPSQGCKTLAAESGQDLFYVVTYPGVTHDFDAPLDASIARNDIANRSLSRSVTYPDAEASYDASRRTFKWFSRWFDPERAISGPPPSNRSR